MVCRNFVSIEFFLFFLLLFFFYTYYTNVKQSVNAVKFKPYGLSNKSNVINFNLAQGALEIGELSHKRVLMNNTRFFETGRNDKGNIQFIKMTLASSRCSYIK